MLPGMRELKPRTSPELGTKTWSFTTGGRPHPPPQRPPPQQQHPQVGPATIMMPDFDLMSATTKWPTWRLSGSGCRGGRGSGRGSCSGSCGRILVDLTTTAAAATASTWCSLKHTDKPSSHEPEVGTYV